MTNSITARLQPDETEVAIKTRLLQVRGGCPGFKVGPIKRAKRNQRLFGAQVVKDPKNSLTGDAGIRGFFKKSRKKNVHDQNHRRLKAIPSSPGNWQHDEGLENPPLAGKKSQG